MRSNALRLRRFATVAGLVIFALAMLLSLLRCGDTVVCPLGYVAVKTDKGYRCEPSPMPPTWATGRSDGGVGEAVE